MKINNNKEQKIIKTVLSEQAVDYIVKCGQPIASHEFIGYIFPATNEMNGVCDLNGQWGFYSCICDKEGNQRPLKEKKVTKYIKYLLKIGFLKYYDESSSPFPEFEYYKNIPIDVNKLEYFDGKLFDD